VLEVELEDVVDEGRVGDRGATVRRGGRFNMGDRLRKDELDIFMSVIVSRLTFASNCSILASYAGSCGDCERKRRIKKSN
jgi:hypothetical protein